MTIQLPTTGTIEREIFPLVEGTLRLAGRMPSLTGDASGRQHLTSLLRLAGEAHPTDAIGAGAYLFAAIIGQKPFTNGNEELAVSLLATTLLLNGLTLQGDSRESVREQLGWLFPKLQWQERPELVEPHEYLLYHLARILADPSQKGSLTFVQEQAAVRHLLPLIARPVFSGL